MDYFPGPWDRHMAFGESLALSRRPPGDTSMWAADCHHSWQALCWNELEDGAVRGVPAFLGSPCHGHAHPPVPVFDPDCPFTLRSLCRCCRMPGSSLSPLPGVGGCEVFGFARALKRKKCLRYLNSQTFKWSNQIKKNTLEHPQFFCTQTNKNFCFPLSSLF